MKVQRHNGATAQRLNGSKGWGEKEIYYSLESLRVYTFTPFLFTFGELKKKDK
jgi:hypothetical protein